MKPTQKTLEIFRKTILDNISEEHKKEILELKFGCKIKLVDVYENDFYNKVIKKSEFIYTGIYEEKSTKITVYGVQIENNVIFREENLFFLEVKRKRPVIIPRNFEIIGRDLTLEDVMVALDNLKTDEFESWNYSNGMIFKDICPYGEDYNILDRIYWKLTKPYQEQEEETLLAIIKLFE